MYVHAKNTANNFLAMSYSVDLSKLHPSKLEVDKSGYREYWPKARLMMAREEGFNSKTVS